MQGVTNEDEFLAVANSDISQLCGEIIVLWNAFKSMFVGRSAERRAVVQHLARIHHIQRVGSTKYRLQTYIPRARTSS